MRQNTRNVRLRIDTQFLIKNRTTVRKTLETKQKQTSAEAASEEALVTNVTKILNIRLRIDTQFLIENLTVTTIFIVEECEKSLFTASASFQRYDRQGKSQKKQKFVTRSSAKEAMKKSRKKACLLRVPKEMTVISELFTPCSLF